jgi:hypothetical protein
MDNKLFLLCNFMYIGKLRGGERKGKVVKTWVDPPECIHDLLLPEQFALVSWFFEILILLLKNFDFSESNGSSGRCSFKVVLHVVR